MKKGFTLAEVLITLTIVGIIAALTVPSVISNYRNRVYISNAKKAIAQLEHATKMIISDEHANNFYQTTAGIKNYKDSSTQKGGVYLLYKYFHVQIDEMDKCVPENYNSQNGTAAGTIPDDDDTYCTKDTSGYTYCVKYDQTKGESTVFIDTNGKAAPNITGIDAFVVKIEQDGSLVDTNIEEDEEGNSKCNTNCTAGGDVRDCAAGCFKKLMDNNWEFKE